MSIRPTAEQASATRVRRRAPLARLVGPVGLAALALFGGAVMSERAEAAPKLCGDRDQILEGLEQKYEETPRALGLSADGGVFEVLVSPRGGWTILLTYPKRPTCVVATGEAWQTLPLAGQPA
jgi:hypothetical protein